MGEIKSEQEGKILSQSVINNVKEIVKLLVMKLTRVVCWQEKVQLYRFLLMGIAVMLIAGEVVRRGNSSNKPLYHAVKEMITRILAPTCNTLDSIL